MSPPRENSWAARERQGWGVQDVAPRLRDAPCSHPLAPAQRPPLTQRRGDTDCAGKAALLRRAAAEAAGGAGGGRGAGLRGRRPAAFAPGPSPGGGSPFLPFPSSRESAGSIGRGSASALRGSGKGAPSRGSTRPGDEDKRSPFQHLDSGSLNRVGIEGDGGVGGGRSVPRDLFLKPRTSRDSSAPLPPLYLPGRRSEGGIRILGISLGTLPAPNPQLRN